MAGDLVTVLPISRGFTHYDWVKLDGHEHTLFKGRMEKVNKLLAHLNTFPANVKYEGTQTFMRVNLVG